MDDSKIAVLLEDLRLQFRNFGERLEFVNEKIDKIEQRMERMEQTLDTYIQQNHREDQQLMQVMRSWIRKSRLKLSEP
jgi:prefoldin subunit 5